MQEDILQVEQARNAMRREWEQNGGRHISLSLVPLALMVGDSAPIADCNTGTDIDTPSIHQSINSHCAPPRDIDYRPPVEVEAMYPWEEVTGMDPSSWMD